jgi:hypothetical protein
MGTDADTHANNISHSSRGNADLYMILMLYWNMKDNWDFVDTIADLNQLPASTRNFIESVKWSWRLASTIRTPGSERRDIMTKWTKEWLYNLTPLCVYKLAPFVYHELLLALQDRHFADHPGAPFTFPDWYDKNYDITNDLNNWGERV